MERPTIEDLLDDLETLVDDERENYYGETEYLYEDEWLTEDELVNQLMEEDHVTISIAGDFVSGEDLDLHFSYSEFYEDDDEEDY